MRKWMNQLMKDPEGMRNSGGGAKVASDGNGGTWVPDWRAVAEQRLGRLVEVEHDNSIIGDRLAMLQGEFQELLLASDSRLQQIHVLQRRCRELEWRLQQAVEQQHRIEAAFLQSRSWRVTKPMRTLSLRSTGLRGGVKGLLRGLIRVPGMRWVVRWLLRPLPRVHAKLRLALYPPRRD